MRLAFGLVREMSKRRSFSFQFKLMAIEVAEKKSKEAGKLQL